MTFIGMVQLYGENCIVLIGAEHDDIVSYPVGAIKAQHK